MQHMLFSSRFNPLTSVQIGLNSTKPVTISSVQVLHATHTRRGFLKRLFTPIVANNDGPYTLEEALREVGSAVDKLNRFGMHHAYARCPLNTHG